MNYRKLIAGIGSGIIINTCFILSILAQPATISTLAGRNTPLDGVGTQSLLISPWQVHARDSLAFFSDFDDGALRKINLITKKVSTLCSNQIGISGFAFTRSWDTVYFATNGNILKRFIRSSNSLSILDTLPDNGISAMACRRNGALIIGSESGHRVAEWTGNGQLRNLAGKLNNLGFVDGVDSLARFNRISSIVLSQTEDTMYIADRFNSRIRRYIRSTKLVSSFNLGNLVYGPEQITLNKKRDSLFIANAGLQTLFTVPLKTGVPKIICGVNNAAGFLDGPASTTRFNYPMGIAISDSGLLVCDYYNRRIRMVKNGFTRTIAGMGIIGDGIGINSRFSVPYDLAKHPFRDSLYVTDQNNNAIRLINLKNNKVSTLVGDGTIGNVSGTNPLLVRLNRPTSLAMSPSGDTLFFVEPFANKIKYLLTRTNEVRWLAGSDTAGYKDHPSGRFARFNRPQDLAYRNGSLYIADALNHKIRQIRISNTSVTTFAGTTAGFKDSTLLGSRFNRPSTLEWVGEELWVGEDAGLKIRKILPSQNSVIRWAGSGNLGLVDGPGETARFVGIFKITYDPFQNGFLVSGYQNEGVCRFVPRDTAKVRTLFNAAGYQDGLISQARFLGPMGYAADLPGNRLFFADAGNNRIRILKYLLNGAPFCTFDTASVNGLEDQSLIILPSVVVNPSTGTSIADTLQALQFDVRSIPPGKIVNASVDASGTLRFQPAPDSNGIFKLRVRLKDNGGVIGGGIDSALYFKTIRINPINDPPVLNLAGNDSSAAGIPRKRPGYVLAIRPGPANESAQVLNTSIVCSNPEWFSVLPSFSGDTLKYEPAADTSGTTQVLIRLKDNGGTLNGGIDSASAGFFIVIQNHTSLQPLIFRSGLRIFPNPATRYFQIQNLPADCNKVLLYDLKGQLLEEIPIQENGSFIPKKPLSGTFVVRLPETSSAAGLIRIEKP